MSGQLSCHPIIETQYARRRPIVIIVVGNHRRAAIRITDVNKSRGSTQQNRSQSGFLPLYSLSGCRYRGASREKCVLEEGYGERWIGAFWKKGT
jgi:hypothetical protein